MCGAIYVCYCCSNVINILSPLMAIKKKFVWCVWDIKKKEKFLSEENRTRKTLEIKWNEWNEKKGYKYSVKQYSLWCTIFMSISFGGAVNVKSLKRHLQHGVMDNIVSLTLRNQLYNHFPLQHIQFMLFKAIKMYVHL